PQPIEQVWKLLEDGARVLGAMHRQGLLHYDVTPGNLMLDDTGARTRFVLTDGGLAHVGPVAGVARGTPQFMAPEVTELGTHDHRCDLYSLGLVAYRFATGRDPIEGGDAGVLRRRREEDAPRARTIRPEIPLTLDAVLAGLLSRDPGARPHDAFDLLDKLSDARGESVARFTHDEGVAAAEGGALVGGTEALARVRAIVAVLEERRAAGTGRLAAARAPKIADPVLILRGRSSAGATRVASEALDLARTQGVPALLMSGRETSGDRRGPLRHLVDGMATLQRAPDEPIEEIRLDLGRRRDLGREERSHAITRAVEHFVRGVETTAKRTPFLLVVQDFGELPERAQQAIRVLSRHLLALRENGGSASAPSVVLVVDIGAAEAESLLIPDAQSPERPLLDTPPLGRDDLLAFTSARFPGIAPDDTDLDRIAAVSEGLPGTLAAMLAEGSRRGDLRYEAGRWSWNVDALDSYELRTGLSPVLAEALETADEDVRALLGYLSLVEAPLEESVVQELWSHYSDRPLPTTPLIRTSSRSGARYFNAATRTGVAISLESNETERDHAQRLLAALASASEPSSLLDYARLSILTGAVRQGADALIRGWATLHAAQRTRAQELISSALTADESLIAESVMRSSLSSLLEYGPHAAASATMLARGLKPTASDTDAGLRIAAVLAGARREREALSP
ncbi:MAG: hypothetical protein P1V36_16860, partial [Planctomycetota bacterium]|nr:hypothetical protein [Planctomycetota bacterium]